jgi:NADPH-dependent 2,4-dienoyl-CoA reductase/sulfur reductase-like enzyme
MLENNSKVISIDSKNKIVKVESKTKGVYEENYDKLILAPGAMPLRPRFRGLIINRFLL